MFALPFLMFCLVASLAIANEHKSPRFELYEYMRQNNCKNMLLTRVLTKIVNENTYYKLSYESIYNLINTHLSQFDRPEIYRCYEVLSQKFISERKINY